MNKPEWISQTNQRVLLILLVGFIFRSIIALWLPPGFDEAYYYIYTQHLDWGYFDHPPLVALTTGIGVWLTGIVSQFTIRLGSLLLYSGSLYFLYRATIHLFSVKSGILTLAIASIIPIFQIGFGILTLPDVPLMFFWALTLWVAAREFFPQDLSPYRPTYRLAIIGFLVGCACLGKYHGLLLGFGLVGFCLTSKQHRSALISPWTLASVLLFLLAFSPVLYWNWQHDWVSFRFQGNRSVPNRSYNVLNALKTALLAAVYMFPTFGVPLWSVSLRTAVTTIREGFPSVPRSLVLWLSMPTFLIFTFIGGYQQILPSWTMPGFFAATPLLGWQVARWNQTALRRWLMGSAIVIATLLAIALLHVSAGIFQKPSNNAILGGFLTPQEDASIQLVDVLQLRREFEDAPDLTRALRKADFVFSNRFHLAGHISMALTPISPTPVTCFDKRDLRGFAFWSTAEQWVGKTGLYVTSNEFQLKEDSSAEFKPYFETFRKLGEIPLKRGGVEVDRIYVFQGTNLLKPFPRPKM
jgi:4-amino-4-deoxy-L-arabinose transferase-like glycosyltransferase